MTQRFEGEVHALRAENAALRAEIAALLAASGAPRSSAAPNNAADAADPPLGSVPPNAFPDHLRTWESPSGADDVLTGADLERYARHVALPSFGAAKQAALARAKVLIVGVGGLGSPAALYLAAAGVGRLALADADHVEVSNLHRQIIHGERSRGVPKAVSAQTALRGLNSRCVVETHLDGFRDENALELIADCDCVLDCTDNVRTRYLISDACALAGVPLVAAAAVGLEGQLTVYCRARAPESAANEKKSSTTRNHPPPRPSGDDTPCYRCVFPTPPARRDCASCAAAGVLGPVPGIMGVLQALEAIKALAGLGDGAAGRMLCFDATAAPGRSFRAFALRPRNPTCVACGDEVSVEKKKITPETLANGEDLTAFVERRDSHDAEGDECAKTTTCARPSKPRTPPPRKNDARIRDGKTSSSLSRVEEDRAAYAALVGALDDAKSAAARNRDQGRGSPGGVVGFPAEDDPGEAAARRADLFLGTKKGPPRFAGVDVSGAPPRVEASFLPPVALDCTARPPLPGSEPGPNRVSPSALRAALAGSTLAGGSSSVPSGGGGGGVMNSGGGGVYSEPAVLVVDVRPRRLSDAACLRRALRVPLRELEARVGEVWAASDALRDAAARDARNRSLDGGGPGPGAVYVVCSRGNDSQLAEAFLRAAGLPVVGDVVGGMEAWRKEIDPTFPKLV